MRLSLKHVEQVNSYKALNKCMLFSFKAKYFYKLVLVFIVVTIIPFSSDFRLQVKGGALRTR